MTRTQCWDDSFRQTYDYTPWDRPPDPIEAAAISLIALIFQRFRSVDALP